MPRKPGTFAPECLQHDIDGTIRQMESLPVP